MEKQPKKCTKKTQDPWLQNLLPKWFTCRTNLHEPDFLRFSLPLSLRRHGQVHTADLKHRIEAQFSDLHQFLYQEEKMLQVKLKTEERRELIRLDEYKAVLSVEISRLRRVMDDIEDKLRQQDAFQLLRVRSAEDSAP